MDPATALGLATAVISAFQEVYAVTRFICRTIDHVVKSQAEREQMQVEFQQELLYLESFGKLYLSGDGIMRITQLDERWLQQLHAIFKHLQDCCASFSRIAMYEDAEYQEETPYQDNKVPKQIDFKAFDERMSSKKKSPLYNMQSWRWALLDRRKYVQVLAEFQKWTSKLKELLPLSIALSLEKTPQKSRTLDCIVRSESAKTLGLEGHARLWQLLLDPNVDRQSFERNGKILEAPDLSPRSALALGKLHGDEGNNTTKVLIEYKSEDLNTKSIAVLHESERVRQDSIQRLASLLSLSGQHDLRTLRFECYVYQADKRRHAFIFNFPVGVLRTVPTSLRTLIGADSVSSQLSLPDRFQMAQTITKTLAALHSANWVHKSICSESVVMFSTLDDSLMIKAPYLVNFEYSRPELASTLLAPVSNLEKALYCHPDRNPPSTPFTKIHDIYSLGVVLLEIGLWCPALGIHNQYRARMTEAAKAQPLTPRQVKKIFIDAAEHRLKHHMGPGYQEAVLTCLRGRLETFTDDADFPIRFEEEVVSRLDIRAAQGD